MLGGLQDYLSGFANNVLRCKAPFFPSKRELAVASWFKNQGDKSYRLNYDLTQDSVVFDLGGFEGQWTSDIFSMYIPKIFVFEPVPVFFEKIKHRFRNNRKITVHPFGLAKEDAKETIYLNNDGSSLFAAQGGPPVIANMVKASTFIQTSHIDQIDLMKINIEGGEYDLLDHLIASGLIPMIKNLQIQFHDFVPHAKARMKAIQGHLAKTHELTYQFEFVWENWARRVR